MSLLSWKPPSRDCLFFFFSRHQKPPRFFHLSLLISSISLSCSLSMSPLCFAMIKLTCRKANGQRRLCRHTKHTHTHTHTRTFTHKPQPLPVFMLHLAEPDFIRDLDLALSLSLSLSHTHTTHTHTHSPTHTHCSKTQNEKAAAFKGDTTRIKNSLM